jgi:hypothetical protein
MRDFLIARRGGVARPRFMQGEWRRVTQELATELFGTHSPTSGATNADETN